MDPEIEKNWVSVLKYLENKTGSPLDMQGVIFLIGTREFGNTERKFKKEEKLDLMHIAVCRLLEPYGYYSFKGVDVEGWPHYDNTKELPPLDEREQQEFMKRAVIAYFQEEGIIEFG
jgi:hypothetical protein